MWWLRVNIFDPAVSLFSRWRTRTTGRPVTRWALLLAALFVGGTVGGGAWQELAPHAQASPDPRLEFLWDVTVRRHYEFPNNDPLGYGYTICDNVIRGDSYSQVMGDVKNHVTPNDEFAANYLVSYAVDMLCQDQVWQLRNSAAHYRPPVG